MMNFGNLILAATSTAGSSSTAGASSATMLVEFLSFGLLIVVLYFIMIRPQRKKEKETVKMRNALQVGDSVVTVSGVIGRVVSIKEDAIVLETGADRNKILVKKWAIQTVETVHDSDFQK